MQLDLQEYRQSETALDIYSPLAKDVARERLRDFLVRQPSNESGVVISGTVSTHQTTVRVRPRRFSLPWRGTFRGAFLARYDGTMITGKFDSNWSLLFVGYPILLGVVVNLGITVVAGHGSGHLGGFALLTDNTHQRANIIFRTTQSARLLAEFLRDFVDIHIR